jgi:non-ribosomal peptide synthetase component F
VRTVHRQVEQQAALKGDNPALVSGRQSLTYRDVNARANALARHLIAGGFRRGDRAVIALLPSPELLIAELAVLKAGGAYACPVSRLAYTVRTPFSVLRDGTAHGIDIQWTASATPGTCPNLPVLVRDDDPACVLADERGALTITVSHGTIAGAVVAASPFEWHPALAPYEHWGALMAGGTVLLPHGADESLESAAA